MTIQKITFRSILLAILLTILLAASNTYLALKVGFLTSASIPAAILSMGILRFFKNSTIYENNLVQTAASAGEAVAGGIAFTAPALILIHFWSGFDYWQNVFIALSGGLLGIFFSIPLRKSLVNFPDLSFPEGHAIAQILQTKTNKKNNFYNLIAGVVIGSILDFCQSGFKFIASNFSYWKSSGNIIYGFGGGFSIPLIGAGYLMGKRSGFSILLGSLFIWLLGVPMLSHYYDLPVSQENINEILSIYSDKIRYIGIGAMLTAGFWTFILLIVQIFKNFTKAHIKVPSLLNKELSIYQDLSNRWIFFGLLFTLAVTGILFWDTFCLFSFDSSFQFNFMFILGCLLYVGIVGFIMVVICSYFSGLVGVSASPGSSVIIGGLIFATLLLKIVFSFYMSHLSPQQLNNIAGIAIIIVCVVTGAACIANDNMQDLKVGNLIGAQPYQQQWMLMLGVLIASLIIPLIMDLLFHSYGIGNVLPKNNMNPQLALSVPPAAMMASVVESVFNHSLPWHLLLIGSFLIQALIVINYLLSIKTKFSFSLLAVAVGMYCPLATSIPMCIGSFIPLFNKLIFEFLPKNGNETQYGKKQSGVLIACGLVTGAAITDVIVAGFIVLLDSDTFFTISHPLLSNNKTIFGILAIAGISYWFHQSEKKEKFQE